MIKNKIHLWSLILFISMISMSFAANVSLKIQNVVLGSSSCSDGLIETQELCEAAGTCSEDTSNGAETQETCEAAAGTCTDETIATQELCDVAGICSDPTYTDETNCEAAVETCSDPTYTDETNCEDNGVCTGACVDSSGTCPDATQPSSEAACLDPADDDDGGSDTAGTWVAHEWTSISWSPETWNPEYEWTPALWTSEGTLDVYMSNYANCTWIEGQNEIINFEIDEAACIGTCNENIGVCTDGTSTIITDDDGNAVVTEESCCLTGGGVWNSNPDNCNEDDDSDIKWEMATAENCCETTGGQWCNGDCTGGTGVYDGGKQGDWFDGKILGFQLELVGIKITAITNGTSSAFDFVQAQINQLTQNSQLMAMDFSGNKISSGEGILLSLSFEDYAGKVVDDGVEVLNGDICFGSLPQYTLISGSPNEQNEATTIYTEYECNCFDANDVDECGVCQGTNTCDGTMTAGFCSDGQFVTEETCKTATETWTGAMCSASWEGALFDCTGECGGSVLADCEGDCGGDAPDTDSDGVCDDVDTCTGINANDTDSDGICDDIDPCPNDAAGDSDCDESCDSVDLCIGDDSTGDSDSDGVCDDSDNCTDTDIGTDVDENGCMLLIVHSSSHIPTEYTISQNYPNPFNPVTNITFNVPQMDEISLVVYDIAGKEVITLASGTFMPGSYLVSWDAVNNVGDAIASGMYVYSYISSEKTITRKMLYLK